MGKKIKNSFIVSSILFAVACDSHTKDSEEGERISINSQVSSSGNVTNFEKISIWSLELQEDPMTDAQKSTSTATITDQSGSF